MPTQDNPLRFLHISDTHINANTDYIKDYARYTPIIGARALVAEILKLPFTPDFILHTGDVAYDPDPHVFETVREVFAPLAAIPIYYLVGNHDDSADLQRQLLGYDEDAIQPFLYYDFEAKGVQVVCLDSNGEHDPQKPSGFVPQAQLDWLDAICKRDDERPLVVAIHHNVVPVHVPWLDDWMRTENGDAVHEILQQARDRLQVVLHGHIHQTVQAMRDGVTYVAAGSSWCSFVSYPDSSHTRLMHDFLTQPSFNMVTVTDKTTSIIRHSFSVDATANETP